MAEPAPRSTPSKRTSFWTNEMQDFCIDLFGPDDQVLEAIRSGAKERGFPDIAVSPSDGQMLRFLVASCSARRAVEIGTLGGYSGSWIARALAQGGSLDTFELEQARADFARKHIQIAAPDVQLTVHVGPALSNLGKITGPVDFVFIDADKGNYPNYLAWAAEHVRSGGIVALDNAFAWGGAADPKVLGDRESDGRAVQSSLKALAADKRFTTAMIPTNEGLAVGVRK